MVFYWLFNFFFFFSFLSGKGESLSNCLGFDPVVKITHVTEQIRKSLEFIAEERNLANG